MLLKGQLAPGTKYIPADITPWTSDTLPCDLAKLEFPDVGESKVHDATPQTCALTKLHASYTVSTLHSPSLKVTVITALGLLEYIPYDQLQGQP